ncbi:coiled-coil domain-containing protein 153 [Plectropomus leopardus]|uniref:coiled-coil domain-containing protein 153 n=1 Tax=Plectropomus leopardus TaxID=160734 RepID=UPI001C4C0A41|nr:coiled-coil domain-containing protein 153 [Plectropomus leopardus]
MATHSATSTQQQRVIPVCSQCIVCVLKRSEQAASQQANMSPKKKTKKPTKKNPEKSESDLEGKYRRSILDVAILQDHIAFQCESIKKVQSDRVDLRRRMRDMEQKLQYERQDHRDVNSDFSRQYKTMQTGLTDKAKRLEKEVKQLKEELVLCQEELRKEKREREQVERQKDAIIADLQNKLDNMETDYEKILHETLDSLTSQLSVARQGWEDKSTTFHQNYKELLSEFGLNALHI